MDTAALLKRERREKKRKIIDRARTIPMTTWSCRSLSSCSLVRESEDGGERSDFWSLSPSFLFFLCINQTFIVSFSFVGAAKKKELWRETRKTLTDFLVKKKVVTVVVVAVEGTLKERFSLVLWCSPSWSRRTHARRKQRQARALLTGQRTFLFKH